MDGLPLKVPPVVVVVATAALIPDSAVKINNCSDQGRARRSKGTEANNYNAV
jgi:hypothetical protein